MLINRFHFSYRIGKVYHCLLHSSRANKQFVKSMSILTGMFLLKSISYD